MTKVGPTHSTGHKGQRRLHGNLLADLKKKLKDKKASTVRSALLASANVKALETGKLNDVNNLAAMRQNRAVVSF